MLCVSVWPYTRLVFVRSAGMGGRGGAFGDAGWGGHRAWQQTVSRTDGRTGRAVLIKRLCHSHVTPVTRIHKAPG